MSESAAKKPKVWLDVARWAQLYNTGQCSTILRRSAARGSVVSVACSEDAVSHPGFDAVVFDVIAFDGKYRVDLVLKKS